MGERRTTNPVALTEREAVTRSASTRGGPPRAAQFDPAPRPGLGPGEFRRINRNGFGDGHNSFAHSMTWFDGRLYVGTTRSNLQMIKIQTLFRSLPVHTWPVEGPDDAEGLYTLDRHAQIWRYDPRLNRWQNVFRAPRVIGMTGTPVARETGYRSMTVFQGESDDAPALYVASWAVSRSPGSLILRSADGESFEPVTEYGIIPGKNITATRVLVPFKGRLFTAPTGTRGHDVRFVINVSGVPVIYESRDPKSGRWQLACESGFGNPRNEGIFTICPFNDQLYAGTFNCDGFELWRTDAEGNAPYRWTKVIDRGAYRGPTNQAITCMQEFDGALYIGSGIQNGGYDRNNDIGPAGAEMLRVHPDDSWDLIVGTPRDTPEGRKEPLSGLQSGFGNVFNGYIWAEGVYDGWLYVGTMDSTIYLKWMRVDSFSRRAQLLVNSVGLDSILANEAGCDLWRTADGENWLPVTKVGFDNEYNLGVRNLVPSPYGLFVACANPFGPRVAVHGEEEGWHYVDNPRGGLEIWLGSRTVPPPGRAGEGLDDAGGTY